MILAFGTVLAAPLHLAAETVPPAAITRMGAPPADVVPLDLGPRVGAPWLGCTSAAYENRALQEATEAMAAALLRQRPAEAAAIGETALSALPCLRAPVEPRVLAAALVTAGVARAALGESTAARDLFRRALSVDPGGRWPAVFVGEPGQAEFEALVAGMGLRGRVEAVGTAPPVWLDGARVGVEGVSVPVGGHLVQIEGVPGAAWVEVEPDRTLGVTVPSAWQVEDLDAVLDPAGGAGRRGAVLGWADGDPVWLSLGARHYRLDDAGLEVVAPRPRARLLAAALGGMGAGAALAGADLTVQALLVHRCNAAGGTPDEEEVCAGGERPFAAARAVQPVFVGVGAAGAVMAGAVWLW